MKRFLAVPALLALIASAALAQTNPSGAAQARDMVDSYCVDCHNTQTKAGGIAMDAMNLQSPANDARVWEKALRKLRGHLMPPPGNPQPPQQDIDSFTAWMEKTLDSQRGGPKAGYVPIERLNRTEYAASVKAL